MITDAEARMYLKYALSLSQKGLDDATIPFEVSPESVQFVHYDYSIHDAEIDRDLWALNVVVLSEDRGQIETLAKQFGARPDTDLGFPLKDVG